MSDLLPPEILEPNTAERIQLVEDIWDSIIANAREIEITEAQKTELDKRWDRFQEQPKSSSTWEQVKQRLQNNE